MLKFIDDWMFDNAAVGYQVLSNRFQKLTGLTCFFLAKCCLISFTTLLAIKYFFPFGTPAGAFVSSLTVLYIAATPFLIWKISVEEKELPANTMNPSRIRLCDMLLRVYCVVVFSFLVALEIAVVSLILLAGTAISLYEKAHWVLVVVSLTSYFYFEACTPLPPQKSTLRSWYERSLEKMNKWATSRSEPRTA